jgi:hypothetical protein
LQFRRICPSRPERAKREAVKSVQNPIARPPARPQSARTAFGRPASASKIRTAGFVRPWSSIGQRPKRGSVTARRVPSAPPHPQRVQSARMVRKRPSSAAPARKPRPATSFKLREGRAANTQSQGAYAHAHATRQPTVATEQAYSVKQDSLEEHDHVRDPVDPSSVYHLISALDNNQTRTGPNLYLNRSISPTSNKSNTSNNPPSEIDNITETSSTHLSISPKGNLSSSNAQVRRVALLSPRKLGRLAGGQRVILDTCYAISGIPWSRDDEAKDDEASSTELIVNNYSDFSRVHPVRATHADTAGLFALKRS